MGGRGPFNGDVNLNFNFGIRMYSSSFCVGEGFSLKKTSQKPMTYIGCLSDHKVVLILSNLPSLTLKHVAVAPNLQL